MKWYDSDLLERVGYDFYCDIANNVVKWREENNCTQKELAEKTGIRLSRISAIEQVHVRVKLAELKKISEAIGMTVEWLIDAELDSQVGECLYLVWPDDCEDLKIYQKATSKRMAALLFEERLNKAGVRVNSGRTRFIVKLVGIPVTDNEIKNKFPKFSGEDEPVYPDEK